MTENYRFRQKSGAHTKNHSKSRKTPKWQLRWIFVCPRTQVTWLVVTEVRSESFVLVTERRHYILVICGYWTSPVSVTHIIFFIVEYGTGIVSFLRYACIRRSGIILTPRLPCAKFHCSASLWRKIEYSITHSVTQSLTELIWCAGKWSFRFGIYKTKPLI